MLQFRVYTVINKYKWVCLVCQVGRSQLDLRLLDLQIPGFSFSVGYSQHTSDALTVFVTLRSLPVSPPCPDPRLRSFP